MRTDRKVVVVVVVDASQDIGADGLAYAQKMSNTPQTLYGVDSAVCLAAWIMLDHDARSYALTARVLSDGKSLFQAHLLQPARKGGHFAVRGQPEIFAAEPRAGFRPLR